MRRIAVVTTNIQDTIQWLMETRAGKQTSNRHWEYNQGNRTLTVTDTSLTTPDIKRYFIITRPEDALGREFDDHIISPFYETLEDIVLKRIR